MPHVKVFHRIQLSRYVKEHVTERIREVAGPELAVPTVPVEKIGFSVTYHEAKKSNGDDLLKDVIIEIPAHGFPERTKRDDAIAKIVADAVQEVIGDIKDPIDPANTRPATVGVLLPLSVLGWAASDEELGSYAEPIQKMYSDPDDPGWTPSP